MLNRGIYGLLALLTLLGLLMNAATVAVFSTDPFTPTPNLPLHVVESESPLVHASGSWTAQNTANASGGSYLYSSGATTDSLELPFQGSRVEIVYLEHPDLGTFAIEIDSVIVRTVVATSETTVFGVRSVVGYLTDEPHILRVYPVSGVIAIDAFQATMLLPFVLYFDEDFDSPMPRRWMFAEELQLLHVPHDAGQALRIPGYSSRVVPMVGGIADFQVHTQMNIEAGTAYFHFSQSAAGGYKVSVSANGDIALYHLDTLLATATTTLITPQQWFTLTLTKLSSQITLSINATQVIMLQGTPPLAGGTFAWGASKHPTHAFLIDEFQVWILETLYQAFTATLLGTPLPTPSSTTHSQTTGQIVHTGCLVAESGLCVRPIEYPTNAHPLPNNPSYSVQSSPDWSPDGTRIVYNARFKPTPITLDFHGMLAGAEWNGTQWINWSPCFDGVSYFYRDIRGAAWSPDGSKIAYMTPEDNSTNDSQAIYVRDLTTCTTTFLTADGNTATDDFTPSWSPTNQSLVIASNRSGGGFRLHTVDVSSGAVTPINAPIPAAEDWVDPVWSPDGTRFAFVIQASDGSSTIGLIDIDGTNFQKLTLTGTTAGSPEWSPDATQLAFTQADPDGYTRIYLMEVISGATPQAFAIGAFPRWWRPTCTPGLSSGLCPQADDLVINVQVDYGPAIGGTRGSFNPDTEQNPGAVPRYDDLIFRISLTNQSGTPIDIDRVALLWTWTEKTDYPEWDLYERLLPLEYNQPDSLEILKGHCDKINLDDNGNYQPSGGCSISGTFDENDLDEVIPHRYCENPEQCGLVWWLPSTTLLDGQQLQVEPVQYKLHQSGSIQLKVIVETPGAEVPITFSKFSTLRIPVTHIFDGTNTARIKSAIFWIIYVETSEGSFEDPALYDEGQSPNQISSHFLRASPGYCNDPAQIPSNSAENEQTSFQGDPTSNWDEDILYLYHCTPNFASLPEKEQHFDRYFEYLMAQVLINAFINTERARGSHAFFSWAVVSPQQITLAGGTEQPTIDVFLRDADTSDLVSEVNFIYMNQLNYSLWGGGNNCQGTTLRNAMEMDKAASVNQPHIATARLAWFHDYLQCRVQQADPEFQQVYNRLWSAVDLAVNEFLTRQEDQSYYPIRGAVFIKAANRNGSLTLCVNSCSLSGITQPAIELAYASYIGDYLTDDPTTIDNREGYLPQISTVLRPVLVLEHCTIQQVFCTDATPENPKVYRGYKWVTLSFQLPANTADARNIPR